MKKILLASTISLISVAAVAEPVQVQQIPAGQVYAENQATSSVYQKQTVVRYNVPTCKNCQTTTTVNKVVSRTEPVEPIVPCTTCNNCATCNNTCTTCAAAPVYAQKPTSCVFDNHKYAIGNPLFVLKQGQFSSETVGGYFVNPKNLEKDRYRFGQWNAAERIMYGITDWLSARVQAGYQANRPKKSTWRLVNGPTAVPHNYSYDGTIGLQAHALDFCNFDLIVGVDATWGREGYKRSDCKGHKDYTIVTPYAIMGAKITKYVTPYIEAKYKFAIKPKGADDEYELTPGFYIQPNKYFAVHPFINIKEHKRPEWNLGLDFYPYQNLMVGIEGSAVSWDEHPMLLYGISGRIKMTF